MKDEDEPGKAPSRPQYKEAHRDNFNMAAFHLCILCCSALDFASFTEYIWMQTLSSIEAGESAEEIHFL